MVCQTIATRRVRIDPPGSCSPIWPVAVVAFRPPLALGVGSRWEAIARLAVSPWAGDLLTDVEYVVVVQQAIQSGRGASSMDRSLNAAGNMPVVAVYPADQVAWGFPNGLLGLAISG